MQQYKVVILGSSSATPTTNRNPSSQFIQFGNFSCLIDCGEGTQKRLRIEKCRFQNLDKIFISHLHGDHYLGLFGLLSTFALYNRTKDLEIYGPAALEGLIQMHFDVSHVSPPYKWRFIPTNTKEKTLLFENKLLQIFSFPLVHRLPTTGFLIQEKPLDRKLNPRMLQDYNIPQYVRSKIKEGEDYLLEDGTLLSHKQLTLEPREHVSYAYCSDTSFQPEVVEYIEKATVLYHESTFLESEKERAALTKHSTAKEAAQIARLAKVKHLLLGHFSSRYPHLHDFEAEAKEIFPNSSLATEGKVIDLLCIS